MSGCTARIIVVEIAVACRRWHTDLGAEGVEPLLDQVAEGYDLRARVGMVGARLRRAASAAA